MNFTGNNIMDAYYSYFENDKNYIGKDIYSNSMTGDIVDRKYKRVFDGTVNLQYYAKDDRIWNEDGSWTGAAIGKIITVTSKDGTVNYYIYKDGEFHSIAQGMKLVDVKAEYFLYEADGKQELYYLK